MKKNGDLQVSDIHAVSRLTVAAVEGLIDLAESLHEEIIQVLLPAGAAHEITSFTYRQVRLTVALASRGSDFLLSRFQPAAGDRVSSLEREAMLAALNGVLGDFLESSGNALAIRMRLRRDGRPLELTKRALAAAIPEANGKMLILLHGLCRCDLQWHRAGHDHGAALARDFGYTPVYLHYNSGLHVSANGREFAALMETLVRRWPVPVEEVAILAHSMGGLVARSACYYGKTVGHVWLRHLRKIIFLGTPHHGAPLERGGNWLAATLGRSPYTAPFAKLGRIRSSGITDLRYGNLLDQDWEGRDRFNDAADRRQPVPLPKGVKCYTIAATTGRRSGDLRDRLLGDGIIPLKTALGIHPARERTLAFPKTRQWVAYGTHHLDLLNRLEVYEKIKEWLTPEAKHK